MTHQRANILTVNVEDYYQVGAFSHLIPFREWERFEDRVRRNLESTLQLLSTHDARATFFVSGWIAAKHPEIFAAISAHGHEIAAQGYFQHSIRELSPAAFAEDIRRSKALLEDTAGCAIYGFRIGRGWIGPEDQWALDVIRREGFTYDASACPIGRTSAATMKYIEADTSADSLISVPVSATTVAGYAIPFAGGNYLRQLPHWYTRRAMARWVESGKPLVAYFHIWELDTTQPSITAAGFLQRMRHYRNLHAMRERLTAMLKQYRFGSVAEHIGLTQDITTRPPAKPDDASGTLNEAPVQVAAAQALTVIVPCYNEQAAIPYLAQALRQLVAEQRGKLAFSFVFVDDGSSDTTCRDLESHFADWPGTQIIELKQNRGIAGAIMAGAQAAQTDLLVVLDADCTFDPAQIPAMLPMLTGDISVVVASPFNTTGAVEHVPPWRLMLSRGAALLYRLMLRNQLSSYTSCFRLYRRADLVGLELEDTGFCGVTEILARLDQQGCTFVETPAVLQVRLLGESKIRLVRVTRDHLALLWRLLRARLTGRAL